MTDVTAKDYRIVLIALAVRGPMDEALGQLDAILDAGAIQDDLDNYAGCEVLASGVGVYSSEDGTGDLVTEVAQAADDWAGDELAKVGE
jgi:hypothetical protein